MIPLVALGIASAVGAAAGGIASAVSNARSSKRTNQANKEISDNTNRTNLQLAREQNQWNLEQWYREIAYNDPSAQIQRLRSAGLSQAGAAQALNNNPAPNLQSADLANQQSGAPMQPFNIDVSGMNIIGALREIQQLRMDKVAADTAEASKTSNIEGILTDNDAKKWSLANVVEDFKYKVQANPYRFQSEYYKAQADKLLPSLQNIAFKIQKMNLKTARQQYNWTEKLNPERLKALQEEVNKIIADAAKTRAETANVNQSTQNLKEEGKGITLRNYGQVIENTLRSFGSPEDNAQKLGALITKGVLNPKDLEQFLKNARSYVSSSGRVFSGNEDLRKVFTFTLNPGIGQNVQLPFTNYLRDKFEHSGAPLKRLDDKFGIWTPRK